MPIIQDTVAFNEVAVLDANAEALGVPVRALMATAGQAIADALDEHAPAGEIIYLVGPGNNGGDALVAARLGGEGTVLVAAEAVRSPLAIEAFDALPDTLTILQTPALDDEALAKVLARAATLVDGLLGAGVRGEPRGEIARVLDAQRHVDAYRLSIDVPTGAGHGNAFEPDRTLALGVVKRLPAGAVTGDVQLVDIGLPERSWTHTGPGEVTGLYPRPAPDQHKGQGGFLLVIGGGPYAGAPALAATAAMRAGADLAVTLTPENVWNTVASFSPNIVARPLVGNDLDLQNPPNRVELNKWLGLVDAVVIGPGLGKMDPVKASVPLAVERALELGHPICADADALWALASRNVDFRGRAVLTPHAKEFEVLTGKAVPPADDVEGRVEVAQAAARQLNATVLLKGPVDVIASPDRVKRNATGTAAMSHGGTGDVLCGVVGGLLAKGMAPFDAARLGAFLSGKAGELATRRKSYGMLATDVLEAVPDVLRTHLARQ